MRLRLGLVSETRPGFLNQVKLCLFSLRKNGGSLRDIPVTLITNSEELNTEEQRFFKENFSPIEFRAAPRLGAIPHTSKLNVFYSIDPDSYDVLLYLDCDTVVRRPLDGMVSDIANNKAQFLCRRGGETDRNRFVDFESMVDRYCGSRRGNRILFEGEQEWPMFNTGVFLATSDAVRNVRRNAVEFTYRIFNEWQRINALSRLPGEVLATLESQYPGKYQTSQHVLEDWPIEQGALALSCIGAGVKVGYLEEKYNSWGGDSDFHVLHCFKSLYKFKRPEMFDESSAAWICEYLASDIPGKVFLANIVQDYKDRLDEQNSGWAPIRNDIFRTSS
jgi:hypothetical protein